MKKLLFFVGLSTALLANEHTVTLTHSDFIPRVINFIIFVAILWYLLADKVKTFYANRSKAIADSFAEVEAKLKESKAEKEALKAKVEEAHKKAEDIVKTAQKEVEIIKSNILNSAKAEVEAMEKQLNDYKTFEENKMKKEVVKDYLNNLAKDIHLSSEEVANIVTKKVG